jgi:RNA polymerase sigma-70 factor (ECF subfamily)
MTPDERTDEEIARAVQKGDRESFGVLMRRYEPKLERYGRKFIADTEAVTDAVQEAFIKAYQNIQSFDGTQRFSPWMYRITHNLFVNALRSKSRNRVFALDLDTLIPHATYEDPAERERELSEMRRAIETGLEKVVPRYREVLVLYYLEEFSYQEIADVLRVPVGTVGVRLARARRELKKHLDSRLLP